MIISFFQLLNNNKMGLSYLWLHHLYVWNINIYRMCCSPGCGILETLWISFLYNCTFKEIVALVYFHWNHITLLLEGRHTLYENARYTEILWLLVNTFYCLMWEDFMTQRREIFRWGKYCYIHTWKTPHCTRYKSMGTRMGFKNSIVTWYF